MRMAEGSPPPVRVVPARFVESRERTFLCGIVFSEYHRENLLAFVGLTVGMRFFFSATSMLDFHCPFVD
jgi:hypothetical protein